MKKALLLCLIVGLFSGSLTGCRSDLGVQPNPGQGEVSSANIDKEVPVVPDVAKEGEKQQQQLAPVEQAAPSEPKVATQPLAPEKPVKTPKPSATTNTETSSFIGEARAKKIALEKAGLSEKDVMFTKVELDRDDGMWEYEVEFRKGQTEYEAEISATDGKILGWDVDIDD